MYSLKIPKEYTETYEMGAAYEAGYYDGRDEAIDSFIPVDDPRDFIIDIKRRKRIKHWELAQESGVTESCISGMIAGSNPSVHNWQKMLEGLGYELWVREKE